MTARKKRALGLSFAVIVVFCAWMVHQFHISPINPLYNGIPLSTHLVTLYGGPRIIRAKPGGFTAQDIARMHADNKKREDSRKALWGVDKLPSVVTFDMPMKVGAEAAPLVTNWLASSPPTGWRLALGKRLAPWVQLPSLTTDRRLIALSFLAEFPIPIHDPYLTLFAAALTNKGPERFAASMALYSGLLRGMKVEKDHVLRLVFPLRSGGSDPSLSGAWAVEAEIIDLVDRDRDLIPLYTLEMGHIPARVGAAMELTEKPRHSERAIPLLITNLTSTNRSVQEQCALALGAYGAEARSALPALTLLLEHPKDRVRTAASNAVATIKREQSKVK